jgi:hypothetical protein
MRVQQHMLARISSVLVLAGAFVVMNAARADATLIVYVCNDASCLGGDDFTITDDGALDANPGNEGSVTYFTAGGGTITASTYPNQGSEAEPFLNLTYTLSAAAFASLAGTPYVFAAQDGFTASFGSASFIANASNGGGSASLYAGAGTFAPGIPPLFSCVMNCAGGAIAPAAPYFLAVGIAPIASARGAAGDATVLVSPQQTVPDGGTTATLLGSILLGFGMLRRKFRS